MKRRIDTLKDTIAIIKKMGAEVGMEITEEEIARKMNMAREQFDGYLNAADKTPNEILGQLWAAYDDVLKAVQRSNRSAPFRNAIKLVKDLGKAKGMLITDEEIVEKIAITREQFKAYLNGEFATPDDVLSLFRAAWPDLLKNVRTVIHRVSVNVEDLDEDVEQVKK